MKKLLNTLFVTSEDAYLTLDGENVVVNREKQVTARSAPCPRRNYQLQLCRRVPGAHGRMCKASCKLVVLHTARAVSGAHLRRSNGECVASTHTIPYGG